MKKFWSQRINGDFGNGKKDNELQESQIEHPKVKDMYTTTIYTY